MKSRTLFEVVIAMMLAGIFYYLEAHIIVLGALYGVLLVDLFTTEESGRN